MSLPVNHVILASGAIAWEAPADVEYVSCSVLHDAEKGLTRIILEGTDRLGDEVRSVLSWSADQSMWVALDYERKHALLMPFGYTIDEEIRRELADEDAS